MNQDQLIRWLMENIDATALAEANRTGSTIMYYAGAAQRFPNTQNVANRNGNTGNERVRPIQPVRETAAPAPRRVAQYHEAEEIQEDRAPAPAPAPARTAARRAARPANQTDTVRVARL